MAREARTSTLAEMEGGGVEATAADVTTTTSDKLISLCDSVVSHLDRIVQLILFEEVREKSNPVLPGLRSISASLEEAILAHGVERLAPGRGDAYNEAYHERAKGGGRLQPGDSECITECLSPGYVHRARGSVFKRALVTTAATRSVVATMSTLASTASTEPALPETAVADAEVTTTEQPGLRVHTVVAGDSLEKLALRYHVQPAAISRLNHLAGRHALHGRKTLQIPPPLSDAQLVTRGTTRPDGSGHGERGRNGASRGFDHDATSPRRRSRGSGGVRHETAPNEAGSASAVDTLWSFSELASSLLFGFSGSRTPRSPGRGIRPVSSSSLDGNDSDDDDDGAGGSVELAEKGGLLHRGDEA